MKPVYKRMLKGMRQKEQRSSPSPTEEWFLYILQCHDGSFYTGITKDIERRVKMHNAGRASRFTQVRRPVKIIYQETLFSRSQALVRECRVKALSRRAKEALVSLVA